MTLPPVYVGARRRWLGLLLVSGIVQAACVVGAAVLIQRTLDAALEGMSAVSPPAFLGGMVLIGLLGGACRWLERHQAERLGQDYVHELRLVMFQALARSAPERRSSEGRGAVPLRFMSDLNALRQWISLGQARLVVASVLLAATLGYLATLNPAVALAVCAVLAINGLTSIALGRRLEAAVVESRRRRGRLAALTAEKAASMSAIIGFGRLRSETRRLERLSRRLGETMNERAWWVGSLRATSEISVRIAIAAVIAVSLHQLGTGTATAGSILAAVSVVALMVTPVRDLGRVYEYWKAAKVSRAKLAGFVAADDRPSTRRDRRIAESRGALRLSRLRLDATQPGFDAIVEPGTRVVVLGANGVGKTTLLWILAGIRRAAGGRVRIDGVSAHRLDRRSLQRSVGIASPDLPLVRGTLRKNLRYRAPDASDEALRAACEAAGLEHALGPWPELLGYRIHEDGANLSDGERARVQLARAMIGTPRILLLDELDSHLDAEGRSRLRDVVRDYPGTVVYTTHDPDTAMLADTCWLIDGRGLGRADRPAPVIPLRAVAEARP